MAGGAGAGADGGAGGGGGGDGRGPSGGSSSSGGRNLRGECPSVCLRLGAEAVPGAARGVPARKRLCLGGGGAGLGLGRRGGRRAAGGQGSRPSGAEAVAVANWPVPVCSQGQTGLCAVVRGVEARGVALGAGRAARGGRDGGPAGSGLQGAGPAAPRTPGNRSRDSGACLPGCGAATAPGWA